MKALSWPLFLLCFLLGCNGNPPTYPVNGKVVFPSGSAVRMGTIETKSRSLGVNARGKIGSDGTFQLTTFVHNDGAVAGIHDCVVVQLVIGEDLAKHGSTFGVVDPKHNSYQTSGLTIEVKPDTINNVVLTVDAFRGKELSEKYHHHD